MDWQDISPRIVWNRCKRRRWSASSFLDFSPEERQKQRNVLIFCWAGQGVRHTQEGKMPIESGSCFWSRPGWPYSVQQNPATPLGITAIHFDLIDKSGHVIDPKSLSLPPERLVVTQHTLCESLTTWIADLAMNCRAGISPSEKQTQAASLMLHGLLVKLSADSKAEHTTKKEEEWGKVTHYIQNSLPERPDVESLAKHFGYTRSHFSRIFKKHIGLSPQQYIINARLALAKELLRETELSMAEVALHSGYSEAFRFSKQFRQCAGCNPTEYRRGKTEGICVERE